MRVGVVRLVRIRVVIWLSRVGIVLLVGVEVVIDRDLLVVGWLRSAVDVVLVWRQIHVVIVVLRQRSRIGVIVIGQD